jgi:phosphopantetheinyl transferase (holo-ACP synthase)
MISFTWTFDSPRRVRGCGVDIESVARFCRLVDSPGAWSSVFSEREWTHARSLPEPALGLCASFACKEAAFKALGHPFNFSDCELFCDGKTPALRINLAPGLLTSQGLCDGVARVLTSEPGQVVCVVCLFCSPPPNEQTLGRL